MTFFITIQISIMGAMYAQNFTRPFPLDTTPEQCREVVLKDWEPHGQVMNVVCEVLDESETLQPVIASGIAGD